MAGPIALPPLEPGARRLATVALSLATFMNVLDTTIANVSLPNIAGDLGVSPSQSTWVITSFGVANAIAVPLTGWLSQRFGQVRLFVTSVVLFVIASWLCGLAHSLEMLIAARVLQGAVAGPMIPLSQALLLQSYPREKSGMALAMWSMTTLVAPVMGPILGGWLSDNLSWPWIFYINLPVGLGAAWMSWQLLRERETPTRKLPIDRVGLVLLVVWVGALQIMLDKGKELDWFESGEIVALGAVALVGFALFVAWELTEAHPVVDLTLFARPNFLFGVIALAAGYGVFFGNVVVMPLWLQQFMGYTATWAGLVTAPIGILALLLSPFIGRIMPRTDPRRIATVAFLVFALVSFLRAGFSTDIAPGNVVLPQVIQGIAMACFFIPLVAITLSGLPMERVPSASGVSNFVRITCGAFGASLMTTLWERRAALHHEQLAAQVNAFNPLATQATGGLQALGGDPAMSLAVLERQVTVQAFSLAANDVFWLSGVLFLVLVGTIWLTRPIHGRPAPSGDAAH
ncbi:MAG TPA: DHA2 family efflux MFS transporter permease subunit [Rhodocyclaceae bacterium]|nr:DHA2 family efflux MFS transporter permease subunit [Rhodocyclaceae bacterium]HNE17849.1 DHA2 family efflux MFS transporter permease subunit [Rhodocyclaceae bacterium]HNI82834.1 DHA2 family efflux MFS transporter permease subunit [Rhodocyclaceae bacterium]